MATHGLALKLEKLGVWGKWLGEEKKKVVLKHLSNQTVWDNFLTGRTDASSALSSDQKRSDFQLRMQVRCLLYGEMALALYGVDSAGISLRPDSVYHTLDHSVDDWQRLSENGSAELANLRHKFGLDLEEPLPSGKPGADVDDGNGEKQKPRLKASREIMSLMPDVKPGKKDLLEDRQNELNEALEHVLTELKNMGEASKPFQCRVKKSEAWDYYTVIQRPMDLGTMTKKLRAYKYPSKVTFQEDIDLIASNCHEYNEKDSLYVQYVDELQARAYALLEAVPDINVLALKSASGPDAGIGKPHPSPLRGSAPSEPSSPDSNSEDEAIAKPRPGFGVFGRPQPGKKMRGKAAAFGKRLLKDRGGVNGPGEGRPDEQAEGVGPVHIDGESALGRPADPGLAAAGDARFELVTNTQAVGSTGPLTDSQPGVRVESNLATNSTLPGKSSSQGVVVKAENLDQGSRDPPSKDSNPRDVSASPRISPNAQSQVGTSGLLDGSAPHDKDDGTRGNERGDRDAEARWPYGEWLQATLSQRMERLAGRAAARHVAFAEQPVLQRTPDGMARYLEDAARKGFWGLGPTGEGAAEGPGVSGQKGVGGFGGLRGLEAGGDAELSGELFMPEVDYPVDCVPDLAVVRGSSAGAMLKAVGRQEPDEIGRKRPEADGLAPGRPEPNGAAQSLIEPPAKRPKSATIPAPSWTDERARVLLRQAVAKLAAREGFDGIRRGALEVLADLLGAHIRRLARTLRLLEERYGGRSPEALLAMCLNGFGVRNITELAAYAKPKDLPSAPAPDPGAGASKEGPPKPLSLQPVKAPKPDPKAPILPVRPPSSTPQFPSVPVFKGVLPKVEADPEKSSSPSLEPEKKKAKPRAKKAAPTTSAAQSRFPGLKSPGALSPTPTAALGLPSPPISAYQPLVNPNTSPPTIVYGSLPSTGVLRSPNMAYGVPFAISSSQPVRPVGTVGLYSSPSLDALAQRPLKEPGKKDG